MNRAAREQRRKDRRSEKRIKRAKPMIAGRLADSHIAWFRALLARDGHGETPTDDEIIDELARLHAAGAIQFHADGTITVLKARAILREARG